MTDTLTTESTSTVQKLNERLKKLPGSDWCHQFEVNETADFVPAENLKYRLSVMRGVFESLFKNRKVLVLNECSGFYPVMIKRAGASAVTANNMNPENCEVMKELSSLTGQSFEILSQPLVLFDSSKIFVDLDSAESYDFLFAQNLVWGFFNASSRNFTDVVDACAHYVTDGLVFDWTDAKWANPPEDYNREDFHAALSQRFEYVLSCNDWLSVALGKLPSEEMPSESSESDSVV